MSASNSTALKRKRRVYKNGCANPLFVKWVEEWRDDARERGVNSHYSYTKVLGVLVILVNYTCNTLTCNTWLMKIMIQLAINVSTSPRHSPLLRSTRFLFLVDKKQKFWIMLVCTLVCIGMHTFTSHYYRLQAYSPA